MQGIGRKLFLYELTLGIVGIAVALAQGIWSEISWWNSKVFLNTFLFALPMLALAWFATSSRFADRGPLKKISGFFETSVMGVYLRSASWPAFLLLSLVAGFSEEILFRGIMQHFAGNIITSLVFGVLHALTPFYFIIATVISLYLGWVFEHSGALLVPVLIHAAYDFLALMLYKKKLLKIL